MQKIVAICLLLIHLSGNTAICQFLKVPKLIAHYQQHHKANHSVSFLDFLVMHYGGDDGTSSDDNEDQQLPFKNIHTSVSPAVAVIIPVQTPLILLPVFSPVTYSSTYSSFVSPGFADGFLRPPISRG